MLRSAILACVVAAPSLAVAAPSAEKGVSEADVEVLVASDPFARWDGTRWRVDAQVMMPFPVALYASKNFEVQSVAFDLRLVTRCELGENIGPRRKEVDCTIESAALSAAPWQKNVKNGEDVLADNVERLTGLVVRLHAVDDGRVVNLTLVGEDDWYRRTQVQYENLRQLLWVAFAGFDLNLPVGGMEVGKTFHEKTSRLWWAPTFRTFTSQFSDGPLPSPVSANAMSTTEPMTASSDFGGQTDFSASAQTESLDAIDTPLQTGASGANTSDLSSLLAPSAMGRGDLANRVDMYKGNYILQFTGKGSVDLGRDEPIVYKGTANGVGVISPYDAILTERVWTVSLKPTPGNPLAQGVEGWPIMLMGKLRRLGDDEKSITGRSAIVSQPGKKMEGLPDWPSLVQ